MDKLRGEQMLQSNTRWIVQKSDQKLVSALASQLQITPIVANLLVNRGLTKPEEAKRFLHIEEELFHDPFLLHDMDRAIERIKKAIENEESILVYGDYDADGVTSTAIMMTALKDLGAKPSFYIPDRFTEGYGPNEAAFKKAAEAGVDLIITVDNGISALHEAKVAADIGIDLIITDHHEQGPELPLAYAILHPKHPEGSYPFPNLAGVGVAFKLAHALYGTVPEHLLDFAAIGTIADLVPLQGENRLLVKKGLATLALSNKPGLLALSHCAGTKLSDVNEETVGFFLAPRLNAAGRIESAAPAVELLLTEDEAHAEQLAEKIDALNKERQTLVSTITKEAIQMVEETTVNENDDVIVVGKEGWNPGVIGIVASRLTDRFYKPTIVCSLDKESGIAKGSGRSIDGFDLFTHLSSCQDILMNFGGHPMAAGLTLPTAHIGQLKLRLNQAAREQLTEEDKIPVSELDAAISIEKIDIETIQQIEKLAPFGVENPKPIFLIKDATVSDMRKIGSHRTHLKINLEQSGATLDSVGFNLGNLAHHISPHAKLSVIGELSVNEWNQIRKPQLMLKDVAVNEWQLFDVRGNKQVDKWVPLLPKERVVYILFNEETIDKFPFLQEQNDVKIIHHEEQAKGIKIDRKNIVLIDVPSRISLLTELIDGKAPARIYAHFFHQRGHFFSTLPTRDHFKWYYTFLAKRRSFHLGQYGEELARYRGWSKDTIEFMSKVFLELDFVTINDGMIFLKEAKTKKDLADSPAYRKKQATIRLENDLIYSSLPELKNWFDKWIAHSALHEEVVAWT